MSITYLHQGNELERLAAACVNKVVAKVDYDHGDDLILTFTDGTVVVIATDGAYIAKIAVTEKVAA